MYANQVKFQSFLIILIQLFDLCYSRWEMKDDFHLPRRDGVRAGFERKVSLVDGKEHTLKTLSMRPTLFEIENFLSPEECNYLIYLASYNPLIPSLLESDKQSLPIELSEQVYAEWDRNSDGILQPMEFSFIEGKGDMYLAHADIMKMFDDLSMDKNNDGVIDRNEFYQLSISDMRTFWDKLKVDKPGVRSRNSNQTFLWRLGQEQQILNKMHERISRLTQLPVDLIETSEPLQVVLYNGTGHYHCHHDSNDINLELPCCVYRFQKVCRSCRYITLLYYLNDVEKGGQTAFPMADNETFSKSAWEREHNELCNLVTNCSSSRVVVTPKQGKAIMWYNHEIESETGWLGELDHMTYHGGCAVEAGEKWIASDWINLIGERGSEQAARGWLQDALPPPTATVTVTPEDKEEPSTMKNDEFSTNKNDELLTEEKDEL